MFCSGCGQPVDPSQQFCLKCGRAVPQVAPVVAPTPWFYTRVHRHIQSLSILWIAYGVWTILGWLLAMSFFAGMFGGYFGHWHHGPFGEFPFANLPWFAPLITVIDLRARDSMFRHRHSAPPPNILGTYSGHRRRIFDAHQAHHRNRACYLHALGAPAFALGTGVRPDGHTLSK